MVQTVSVIKVAELAILDKMVLMAVMAVEVEMPGWVFGY